jgi:hypothetical protein
MPPGCPWVRTSVQWRIFMRYIRFSNAAIAVDHELPAVPKAPREPAPPSKTFWALNTLQGKLGTYVAIQARGDQLFVGVRAASHLSWVRADQALTTAEAQAWFPRAGFAR